MKQLKFALALSGLLLSTSAFAGTPGWTMSEASGPVTVASSGLIRVANRGATLNAGDVISTGAKGRAVIVRGQEYLVIAPGSQIKVADPAKSGGMTQIIEQIGNVVYKIKKMTMPHFAVETPFLAAVVKGTTFSVTVTESGASVQVLEGRVEVETRDGGAHYLVLPGDIGSVARGAPGRLNVQGRETRSIDSPTAGGSAAAPTAQILQAEPAAAADVHAEPASANAPAGPVIAEAVSEPPVALGTVTGGMVSGALLAVATPAPQTRSESTQAREGGESRAQTSAASLASEAGSSTENRNDNEAKASRDSDRGDGQGDSNKNGSAEQRRTPARDGGWRDALPSAIQLASARERGNEGNGGSSDNRGESNDESNSGSSKGNGNDSSDRGEDDDHGKSGSADSGHGEDDDHGKSGSADSGHGEADAHSETGNADSGHGEADAHSETGNADSGHGEADAHGEADNSNPGHGNGNGNSGSGSDGNDHDSHR